MEEMVAKVGRELDVQIKEAGEASLFELGIHGVHPEITRLLGGLKFRTSYSQNVLVHSIEVGFLCGIMASELGMNDKLARRAGLLHDIGKALSHEIQGSHAIIGADCAKKYGEDARVVHAIAAHHEDVPQTTSLAHLVDAADALSGARPGARSEVLESYVKRVEDLERIAKSFEGVEKVYAIQAGREVRVMVENDRIDDSAAAMLSRNIARKIEQELTYPGQIKVVVIREARAVDFAK
jgi:ribonuclease Y